jgi:hypothetical protein
MVDGGVWSKAVSGDKVYTFRVGLRGYRAWSCSFTHDGTPDANDLLSVRAWLED